MDELLEQSLLYDFYGELLTEHQKAVYEQFITEDLSLSEIADDAGISRQAVHDLIKRCKKILEAYEEKLHLVEKFLLIREQVQAIDLLADELPHALDNQNKEKMTSNVKRIQSISQKILEEL